MNKETSKLRQHIQLGLSETRRYEKAKYTYIVELAKYFVRITCSEFKNVKLIHWLISILQIPISNACLTKK